LIPTDLTSLEPGFSGGFSSAAPPALPSAPGPLSSPMPSPSPPMSMPVSMPSVERSERQDSGDFMGKSAINQDFDGKI